MSGTDRNAMWVMLLVFLVSIVTPFGNDVFLASIPSMSAYFHVSNMQLIMTVFLGTLAGTQLFYGPFSDRFGRKPVLLVGLGIMMLGSLLTMIATHFSTLMIGRGIQAVGISSAIVSVLAIIRDSYPKSETIKYVAIVMGIIGVSPLVSPVIGSAIQLHFGWRGNMTLLFLMGAVAFTVIAIFFRESMKEKNMYALKFKQVFCNYAKTLKHKQNQGFVFSGAFGYAALFTYIAASPTIIMTMFHRSVTEFAILFAINSSAIFITAFLAPKLSQAKSLSTTLHASALLILAGGVSLFLLTLFFKPQLWMIIASMYIMSFGVGLMRPTASAGAIKLFPPKMAGSASGMYTFVSFAVSAIVVSFVHVLLTQNILLFAALISGFGIFTLLSAARSQCLIPDCSLSSEPHTSQLAEKPKYINNMRQHTQVR